MNHHRIAVVPGDGIGQEVIPPTLALLETCGGRFGISFEWKHFDWSADYYLRHGRMMPEDGLDQLRHYDAILLGAVRLQELPDNVTLNGPSSDQGRNLDHGRSLLVRRVRKWLLGQWGHRPS